MRRMKLELDAISVDSFDTSLHYDEAGTIQAHYDPTGGLCGNDGSETVWNCAPTCGCTGQTACNETCDPMARTCDNNTCAGTCNQTCLNCAGTRMEDTCVTYFYTNCCP